MKLGTIHVDAFLDVSGVIYQKIPSLYHLPFNSSYITIEAHLAAHSDDLSAVDL